MTEKYGAWIRETHSTWGSLEEARTELVFEVSDLPTQGWLRDTEPVGGASGVTGLGHGDEIVDLGEAHVEILHRFGASSRSNGYWNFQRGACSLFRWPSSV